MESIDIKEEVFFEDSTKEIKEELELTKVKCEDSKEGILDDEFAVDIKQIQMKEKIYVWNSFESAQEGSSTDSLTHSVSTTRIQKTDEENQIDYKLQRKRELVKARVKRYRERKRMESQRLNSMQDDPTEDEIAERKRAMSRERSRRYYERKQMESRQLNPSLQDDPTEEEIAERKRALAKERSRRYRERKRMESRQLNTSMQDDPNEEDIGEGTFEKIS